MLKQADIFYIARQLMHMGRNADTDFEGRDFAEYEMEDALEFLRDQLIAASVRVPRKRQALIECRGPEHAVRTLSSVKDYLPNNYSAYICEDEPDSECVMIEGYDDRGWTLDGYVIPRLASGLIVAKEIL